MMKEVGRIPMERTLLLWRHVSKNSVRNNKED
jgi:hypothetical protein